MACIVFKVDTSSHLFPLSLSTALWCVNSSHLGSRKFKALPQGHTVRSLWPLVSTVLLRSWSEIMQYSSLESPMDGQAWWATVHGLAQSQTWPSDFTFTFHFHALKKEMAAHSSVLAWRIPGTGEPGGLPSMGSHRVRHDWSDLAAAAAAAEIMEPDKDHFLCAHARSVDLP